MTLEELELTSDGFIIAALPERENIDTMIRLKGALFCRFSGLGTGENKLWDVSLRRPFICKTLHNTPEER